MANCTKVETIVAAQRLDSMQKLHGKHMEREQGAGATALQAN